jgi:hypothetical protein
MKKILSTLIILLFSYGLKAQFVDGVDISGKAYIQILNWQKSTGGFGKNNVFIDYGQKDVLKKNVVIRGKDGNVEELTNYVATLNFFANNGWELVGTQTIESTSNVYRQFAQLKNKSKPDN